MMMIIFVTIEETLRNYGHTDIRRKKETEKAQHITIMMVYIFFSYCLKQYQM